MKHKIINKSGIPDIFFQMILESESKGREDIGDFSATELLSPIQQLILDERHGDKIEVDALSLWKAVRGSAIHALLAKTKIEGAIQEERMKIDIYDFEISGQPDIIVSGKIKDLKNTNIFSYIYDKDHIKDDWRQQFSFYRYLYWKKTEITLDDIATALVSYDDWRQVEYDRFVEHGKVIISHFPVFKYPPKQLMEFDVPLYPVERMEYWLVDKLQQIEAARELGDDKLPPCTNEERWHNEKKGYIRCQKYCVVKDFCKQLVRDDNVMDDSHYVSPIDYKHADEWKDKKWK